MQNTFTVSPMEQKIVLDPGEFYQGSIIVANPAAATEDFKFTVSVSPFSVTGTDYKPDFQTESDWSRITKWISLDTTGGTLKPNETKEIHFTIQVPNDAPAGGQYAMIGVSSVDDSKPTEAGMVKNVFEMASLIYANISGEEVRAGQITKNQIPSFVMSGEPVLELTFSNTGNVHEVATTTLAIKNIITGETILPKENQEGVYETIVMPDSVRNLSRTVEGVAALGIYEVKQNVKYLDEESSITTVMVVCPLWFILLVILTIASIIGMFVYSRVLRKKKLMRMKQADTSEES